MKTSLQYDTYFHIYNRGINSCPLFTESTNYEHFMGLWEKYISPIADTYAWVLMGNHFHFLIKTKTFEEVGVNLNLNLQGLFDVDKKTLKVADFPPIKPLSQQFSNLFNAYTKAFNKKYHRTGALFEHNFRRIEITDRDHLLYLIYYIHHNPVHHRFCNDMMDYPWSSYLSMMSPRETHLSQEAVLSWFANVDNYKAYHKNNLVDHLMKDLHLE